MLVDRTRSPGIFDQGTRRNRVVWWSQKAPPYGRQVHIFFVCSTIARAVEAVEAVES